MASETSETPPRPRDAERPSPAELNGKAAGGAPCEDCAGAPPVERALGLLGVLVGAVVLAMGLDLVTGGAISRAVGFGGGEGDGDAARR
jgi:hypothetical protein